MVLSKNTLTYRLLNLKQENPDFEAFVSYNEDNVRQAIKFSEFMQLCSRFSYILKQEGVLPGDYVATTVPLCIEDAVVTFGIILSGAVPTSLEVTFNDAEAFLQCMEKTKSRLLITTDETFDDAHKLFKSNMSKSKDPSETFDVDFTRLPCLKKIMLIGRSGKGKTSFLDMLRSSKGEFIYEVHENMTCFLHFTTGTPTIYLKMTEMSHGHAVDCIESLGPLNPRNYSKMVYTNPWFWVSSVPYDTLRGVTRVIPDKWTHIKDYPTLLYRIIKSENIEFADIQPVNAIDVMKIWKQNEDTSKPLLKLHTIMGMPTTLPMLKQFQSWTESVNLIYGSHEVGACFLNQVRSDQIDNFKDFDCGTALPGNLAKVVDENRIEVAPGVKGRLLLKTCSMFKGYPAEPERTARCFDHEGWFVTNDQASISEDKHLFVGGRIDSIILHGEYMIYPVWIEDMVAPLPEIEKVVVVPVMDEVLFHAVGVCVIKKPGTSLTLEQVVQKVASYIVPFKEFIFQPKHLLFFNAFPLKENGEVDRSKLFDIVHEKVNGI